VPSNSQVAERLGNDNAALGKLSEITHQQALSMVAVLLTRKLPEGLKAEEAH